MRKSSCINIIATLFIILFTYAAASKLAEYAKFRSQLGLSPLLTAFAGWISWLIPAIEIIIALLLISQRHRLIALYASFSLMTMFTAYIIVLTKFADFVPCSCGGVLQNLSWNQHIVFNIFFIVIAIIGIVLESKTGQLSQATLN